MNNELAKVDNLKYVDAGHQQGGVHSWQPDTHKNALPATLPIFPVTERPFFPRQVTTFILDEARLRQIFDIEQAARGKLIGIVMLRDGAVDGAKTSNFHTHGTVARIVKASMVDSRVRFAVEGLKRFRIEEWASSQVPFVAEVEYLESLRGNSDEIKAYGTAIINVLKQMVPLNPLRVDELKTFVTQYKINDPEPFADLAANLATDDKEKLQAVLDTAEIVPRLEKVLELVGKELEIAKLQAQISERADERLSDSHRKFVLRAQLKEIQQELGIGNNGQTADEERFRKRLDGRKLPDSLQQRLDEELDKLSSLEARSPEFAVTRNYLDWLTALPWAKYSDDNFELSRARAVLDTDHYGLVDVKERIIEFLAVGAYKGDIAGSILLLVGPPGVGKTSIGRSVATALGRRFFRFSLGGMRDEAEIKGHRRTYVAAMPGKFIQAMKEVDASNPVIMLDEIDKVGASYRGDPASALLEALDPEHNSDFLDHYLDLRFDLSKALFICTANQNDTIPAPLLDRMEVIELAGYMTKEKVEIARQHLWPKQLTKAGVEHPKITITDSVLLRIVEEYAREAGVRNLEKQLGRIVRKGVVKLVEDENNPIHVEGDQLESYLGMPIFRTNTPRKGIGIVTGLAWTSMGGDTLTIEATRVHTNNRGFQLTGNLGDVMKESASIAYSYITANAASLGGDTKYFEDAFVHLHVPEGATPKDGPSAGVTMATSLLSLARQQVIQKTLAMSGELTLTGRVLAIGGIKEKIIAARRASIHELILPADNQRDFDSLPEQLREGLIVHFAQDYQDVARIAFSDPQSEGSVIRTPIKQSETTTCIQIG